jgi:hypothetical protein
MEVDERNHAAAATEEATAFKAFQMSDEETPRERHEFRLR